MISWFVNLSPALGSVLTAQSLEPALILRLPHSLCSFPAHALSFSVSKININKMFLKENFHNGNFLVFSFFKSWWEKRKEDYTRYFKHLI